MTSAFGRNALFRLFAAFSLLVTCCANGGTIICGRCGRVAVAGWGPGERSEPAKLLPSLAYLVILSYRSSFLYFGRGLVKSERVSVLQSRRDRFCV